MSIHVEKRLDMCIVSPVCVLLPGCTTVNGLLCVELKTSVVDAAVKVDDHDTKLPRPLVTIDHALRQRPGTNFLDQVQCSDVCACTSVGAYICVCVSLREHKKKH